MEQVNKTQSEEINIDNSSVTSNDETVNEVSVQEVMPKEVEANSDNMPKEVTELEEEIPPTEESKPIQSVTEAPPIESSNKIEPMEVEVEREREATEEVKTEETTEEVKTEETTEEVKTEETTEEVKTEETTEEAKSKEESDKTKQDSDKSSNDKPETQKAETKESLQKPLPNLNFSIFNTEEIIAHAKELIDNYPVNQLRVLDTIPQIFEAQLKKEYNAALSAHTASGSEEPFEYNNDSKERFYSIYRQYREKRSKYYKRVEEQKEENLKTKLQIIEELKELIQKEESLNKTFQEFRGIQDRWRNTGMVPQANLNDLLETYHLHVENFYNHIKINKELRDLDLKKNMDSKIALCEEAERLVEENNIGLAFRQLQQLHAQWKEIGPVPNDQKEILWERFKESTNKINDSYHRFFESLREEQANNLKIKEDICAKTETIALKTYTTPSGWNEATKKILELQDDWKHSGTVPQKERNRIYKRFRSACDNFFNTKRQFYQLYQAEQTKNLELKIALCEKVEAIKDSTDWRTTTDKIIAAQKEWKKIGPAPKRYSNKVWLRFRGACDDFFNRKTEHMKSIGSDQQHNLELKKALIEEIRNFKISENKEEDLEALRSFQTRWTEIGFVPIRQKDVIQSEFRTLLNDLFDQLDIDEFERNLERFKSKVSTFESSDAKDFKIVQEREKLVNRIKQLETDLNVWENNIGFFSKSRKSDALIKEFTQKIEIARHKLELMQEKLKVIDNLI